MNHVLCRHCEDDFDALLTAQGMTNAGCEVFSISSNGQHTRMGAMIETTKFIVWGRYTQQQEDYQISKLSSEEIANGRAPFAFPNWMDDEIAKAKGQS